MSHIALIEKLTQTINDSPTRLMSDAEIAGESKLTESEFLRRAKNLIHAPESSFPAGEEAKRFTLAILAKQYRRRLPPVTAHKYMKPLLSPQPEAEITVEKLTAEFKKAIEEALVPEAKKAQKTTAAKKPAPKKAGVKIAKKSPVKATPTKKPTKKK